MYVIHKNYAFNKGFEKFKPCSENILRLKYSWVFRVTPATKLGIQGKHVNRNRSIHELIHFRVHMKHPVFFFLVLPNLYCVDGY